MKIILKKNIPGLGSKEEIKEVKPGYYYNFLLPQGLATVATKQVIREREEKEKKLASKKKQALEKAEELNKKIEGEKIELKKKATKKKLLYAQIKPEEIVEALEKQLKLEKDFLKPEMINLDSVIKRLGDFEVKVRVGENQEAKLKLKVVSKG